MSNKPGRRRFIKNLGVSGLTASLLPSLVNDYPSQAAISSSNDNNRNFPGEKRLYNGIYNGPFLNRIAFPIGGLGAGMFCLEGTGAISHMSVRNKPDVFNEPGLFAAIHIKGLKNGTKILEGPVPDWKKFGRPDTGNGSGGSIAGLPHFSQATFNARFPFARITLDDKDIPIKPEITGWSPFIPTDDNNSSLPAGALEYSFTNGGTTKIEGIFSYNAKNFMKTDGGKNAIRKIKNGFILSEGGTKESRI